MITTEPKIDIETLTDEQRVLIEAAELLERDGWTAGTWCDHTESRCAIGALTKVLFGHEYDDGMRAEDHLDARLRPFAMALLRTIDPDRAAQVGHPDVSDSAIACEITTWNDRRPARTVEMVVDTFRRAALG